MIKFNPENKEELTYGEALGPISKITDQQEAKQYLADYIAWCEKHFQCEGYAAGQVCLHNIGYYAGYYDPVTQQRINELFKTKHPIL